MLPWRLRWNGWCCTSTIEPWRRFGRGTAEVHECQPIDRRPQREASHAGILRTRCQCLAPSRPWRESTPRAGGFCLRGPTGQSGWNPATALAHTMAARAEFCGFRLATFTLLSVATLISGACRVKRFLTISDFRSPRNRALDVVRLRRPPLWIIAASSGPGNSEKRFYFPKILPVPACLA